MKTVALGIACAVLVFFLIVAGASIANLQSEKYVLQRQVDELNSIIRKLQSEKDGSQTQVDELKKQVDYLQKRVYYLQWQVDELNRIIDDLNSIIRLEKSQIWINRETISQPAGQCFGWGFSANYAGYVSVHVHSSTTDKTYVWTRWYAYGILYDEKKTVGTSGTANFPVLPTSQLGIWICNSNLMHGATQTVTIVYHY